MQIHQLRRAASLRRSRRIGRGGKRGTYSGRGIKGQRSRAGAKIRPAERDILKRMPKLRGYKFQPFRQKPAVVNLDRVAAAFPDGARITPAKLVEKGLVARVKGRVPRVKILGMGILTKKFIFQDVFFSRSARAKTAP